MSTPDSSPSRRVPQLQGTAELMHPLHPGHMQVLCPGLVCGLDWLHQICIMPWTPCSELSEAALLDCFYALPAGSPAHAAAAHTGPARMLSPTSTCTTAMREKHLELLL